MSTGKPLKVPFLQPRDVDLVWLREQFLKSNSRCEVPGCEPKPAFMYHQNKHSFCWICEDHWKWICTATPKQMLAFDKALSEHMWAMFMRKSFAAENERTGFALERAIEAREKTVKQFNKAEQQAKSQDRTEIRRNLMLSTIKPGTPDDALLTAQGRQAARKDEGKQPLGRARTERKLLRSKLIVRGFEHPEPIDPTLDKQVE